MKESFVFSEFIRRLNNIVRFGTVLEVDHKKARVRVKIGKITTTWIPWTTTAGAVKLWNPPVIGEQVSVIAQGGDLSLSVVIPSIFQNKFAAPGDNEHVVKLELSDKSSIEFNKENNEMVIKTEDSEIVFNKDKLEIKINESEFVFDKDNLKAKIGEADLDVKKDKVKLSVGSSLIEVTQGKISLHSPIIDAPTLKMGLQ